MKNVCTWLLLTCAGTSLALAQGSVDGEKWRITSSMQMSGMTLPGQSSEICKQPGDDAAPIRTDDNCQIYDMKRSGNVQSFKMRCTGKDAVEGSAQFTYLGPDRYQGKMEMTTQGETMTMAYDGQKLGKCDGSEANLQAKKMIAQSQRLQAESEKQMAESCRKQAAAAEGPSFMMMCKDPADQRTYCENVRTHDNFKRLAQQERQAPPQPDGPYAAYARPLTETARVCGFAIEQEREKLCHSAEQNGNLLFIGTECPVQGAAIASAQCAGRRYTAIAERYRGFCAEYASNQDQGDQPQGDVAAQQQEPATPMDKTKGLLNKGKKALGGLFSN